MKFSNIELASIYFDSIPISSNNTFLLDFTNKNITQSIFFSKKSQYFITNLDCQLNFSDQPGFYSQTDFEKVQKEYSDLVRKYNIARKDYQEVIDPINLKGTENDEKTKFKLDLNDTNIQNISFKLEYYDTTDKITKSTYIYDPFMHLTLGMRFKEESPKNNVPPMIYNVQLIGNTIYKSVDFSERDFDFDSVYTTRNSIFMYDKAADIYHTSNSYYQVIFNADVFAKREKSRTIHEFIQYYWNTIAPDNKIGITTREIYNKMTDTEKKHVAIIINKKDNEIFKKVIYVAPRSFRGTAYQSFLNAASSYDGTVDLTKKQIDKIKETIPNFPITKLEKYTFNAPSTKFQWEESDLNFYPSYNKPSNTYHKFETDQKDFAILFDSSNTILNKASKVTLSPTFIENFRVKLQKNIIEIQKKKLELDAEVNRKYALFQKNFFLYDNK